MNFLHKIIHPLLAALCFLLVSCIEGREEIWLNANGSGRADISYSLPATAAKFNGGEQGVRNLVERLLKDMPENEFEVTTVGDRMKVRVKIRFSSPGELAAMTSSVERKRAPASFEHLAGKFQIDRSFRTVDFTRIVSPGKALPVGLIPVSQFKDRSLTYIVHLPVVPIESTATRTADAGRTLIWETPLTTAIREPINMHFKAKIPIPTWMILAATGITLLILLGILFAVRRLRNHFAGTSRK